MFIFLATASSWLYNRPQLKPALLKTDPMYSTCFIVAQKIIVCSFEGITERSKYKRAETLSHERQERNTIDSLSLIFSSTSKRTEV